MNLKENAVILFQGDSVTDAGRDRADQNHLGGGYPKFVAEKLGASYPGFTFINKGISGNTSTMLLERWKEDTLDLKPDFISILIGINDTWRRFDSNSPTSEAQFEENYRTMLTQVKALGTKVMMMEPFNMPVTPDRAFWRVDLDPKIQIVRKLARQFADVYLPLDGFLAAKALDMPMNEILGDGVHPTETGHRIIADEWVKGFEKATK